jgi:hypothetical protein
VKRWRDVEATCTCGISHMERLDKAVPHRVSTFPPGRRASRANGPVSVVDIDMVSEDARNFISWSTGIHYY